MIKRLNIKHYNTILTEKLQKDQQYHQAKYKYKYLKNEEVLTSSQSHITQKPLQGLEKHLTNRQFQLNGMETKKTEGIRVEEIWEQSDQSEKSINFYQSI